LPKNKDSKNKPIAIFNKDEGIKSLMSLILLLICALNVKMVI